jgi:hypothetical protein
LVWFGFSFCLNGKKIFLKVALFLIQGLLSLTLMSVCVTSIFWLAVLRTGLSREPVGFKQLWPWVLGCIVVLFALEFMDGILYFSPLNYNEDLLSSIQNSLFALVSFATGQLLLWSGTFLLRRVRIGQKLKTTGRTRFQTSVSLFVICELSCCLVLSIWFLIAAWAGPMLTIDNVSWWAMWTVFYSMVLLASSSVISTYYREPKKDDLPTPEEWTQETNTPRLSSRSMTNVQASTGVESVASDHDEGASNAEEGAVAPPDNSKPVEIGVMEV